jgi:spore coat polysaccharide biosynthesis protein SpsF
LKVVAIIQARMGSTRLPGKVLKDLGGKTVLGRVVERLQRCKAIDEVLVATTDRATDDAITAECRKISAAVSRGDQDDVLDRYFRAAQLTKADVVVRITSDCPMIDPEVTDKTVAAFLQAKPDYASNVMTRTYPRGLDTEVFSFDALGRAWQHAHKPYEREHVTPHIFENPSTFKLLSVTCEADHSDHRWTVDTQEDLDFVQAVYSKLPEEFSWKDVLELVVREPELEDLNRSVRQKVLHEG